MSEVTETKTPEVEAPKKKKELCATCKPKAKESGIEWQDLCAVCYKLFVK